MTLSKNTGNKKSLIFHEKLTILTIVTFLTIVIISTSLVTNASAEQNSIPIWIKNKIKLCGTGQIGDPDFINGLEWFIQNKIIIMPQENGSNSGNPIPNWVKNTTKLWSNDQISDTDFIHNIQFLINLRIINIGTMNDSTPAPTLTSQCLDKFGIAEMNPTKPNGREWFSKWDDGNARSIISGQRDPHDLMFKATGDARITINGKGIANMSGKQPRMYVYDPAEVLKWRNIEVTFYGKRVNELIPNTSAGFNIGARSNHQNDGKPSYCNVDTYYSRMLYAGHANFMKELYHPDETSGSPVGNRISWGGDGTIPYNMWIGHKLVLRDYDSGTHVKLQMYLDQTGGVGGGNWKLVAEWKDDGNWLVPTNPCNIPVNKIILEDNPSVFIRNTEISSALYEKFSIREITPLP